MADLDALIATLENHAAGIDAKTIMVVRKVAFETERRTKINTPVDTGNLKNSWRTEEVTNTGREFTMIVGSDVGYAPYIENGTSRMAPRRPLGRAVDVTGPMLAQAIAKIANPLADPKQGG